MRSDRLPYSGLLLLVVALQAPPAVAWARPSPPAKPSPPAAEAPPAGAKTADDYALEGRKLALQPGKLLDARALLLTAWSMKRSYDIAGNLGSVELELGMMRDAAEHLSYCQQNFPAVRDAEQTEKLKVVESLLTQARAQVGGVRIRVTDGDGIELEGAEVLVDNKVIGRAPLVDEVFVDPGTRVISARRPGHREASKQIQAEKGGSSSVTVVLPSITPSVKSTDATPAAGAEKRVVLLAAGAGLAAAFAGVGVGFHLASNGKSGDAEAAWSQLREEQGAGACRNAVNKARCDELHRAYDGRELFRGVAIGGYVAGGVLAVGTLAYALLPASVLPSPLVQQGAPATKRMRASVSITPSGGGAVLEGTF